MKLACSLPSKEQIQKLQKYLITDPKVLNTKVGNVRLGDLTSEDLEEVIKQSFSNPVKLNKDVFVKCSDKFSEDVRLNVMIQNADGFIGEISEEDSPLRKVFESYNNSEFNDNFDIGNTKASLSSSNTSTIILARDEKMANKPLDDITKESIKNAFQNNKKFIVGDNPITDMAIIEYLIDLGAVPGTDFKIYYTKESRITDKNFSRRQNSSTNIEVSFDSIVQSFVTTLETASELVERDKDFANNHTRYIDTEQGKQKVDYSVSQLQHKLSGKSVFKKTGPQSTAAEVGNLFDTVVRNYFQGNLEYQKEYSKYITKEEFDNIKSLCKEFEERLKNTEGIGVKNGKTQQFKVISQEFDLGAIITDSKGEDTYFAGSPDLLIITENNDVFIFDMKTVDNKGDSFDKLWNERINDYNIQQFLYKKLLEENIGSSGYNIIGFGYFPVSKNSYIKDGKTQYHFTYDKTLTTVNTLNHYLKNNEVHKAFSKQDVSTTRDNFGEETANSINEILNSNNTKDNSQEPSVQVSDSVETNIMINKDVLSRAEKAKYGAVLAKNILYYAQSIMAQDSDVLLDLDIKLQTVPKSLYETLFLYGDNIISAVRYKITEQILEEGEESSDYKKLCYISDNFYDLIRQTNVVFKKFGIILNLSEVSTNQKYVFENITEDTGKNEEDNEVSNKEGDYDVNYKTIKLEQSIQNELKTKLSLIRYAEWGEDGVEACAMTNDNLLYSMYDFVPLTEVLGVMFQRYRGISKSGELFKKMQADIDNKSVPAWMQYVHDLLSDDPRTRAMTVNSFYKAESVYSHIIGVASSSDVTGEFKDFQQEFLQDRQLEYYHKDKIQRKFFSKTEWNEDNVSNKNAVPRFFKISSENPFNLTLNKEVIKEWKNLTIKEKLDALGVLDVIDQQYLTKEDFIPEDIVDAVDNLKARCENALKVNDSLRYNEAWGRKDEESLDKEYSTFLTKVSSYLVYAFEPTVYDQNSFAVINQISLVQRVIDDISKHKTQQELRDKYSKYRMFFNPSTGKYVNSWLDWLLNEDVSEQEFEERRKVLTHAINTSTLSKQYQKQSPEEQVLTILTNYQKSATGYPRFRVPVMSDKQADESVSFYSILDTYSESEKDSLKDFYEIETKVPNYIDLSSTYKNYILSLYLGGDKLYQYYQYEKARQMGVLEQWLYGKPSEDVKSFNIVRHPKEEDGREVLREKLINLNGNSNTFKLNTLKGLTKKDIQLFQKICDETRGLDFLYSPFIKVDASKILTRYQEDIDKPSADRKSFVNTFVENIYGDTEYFMEKNKSILDKFGMKDKNQVASMLANDYIATCNIENLTSGDLAYYKDTIDFQKRNAQIHAMTLKADKDMCVGDENTASKYLNKKISDGKFRYIVVKDYTTSSKLGIEATKILDKKIARIRQEQSSLDKKSNEYLLLEDEIKSITILKDTLKAKLNTIDEVTDGQSLGSPTSFWKKLKMLGEDMSDFEEALKEIRKGNYSFYNIQRALHPQQPIKSFIYDLRVKENSNTSLGTELVPTQIKHSEAMLLAATIISSDKSTPMAAMFEFMENSHYSDPNEHSLETYVNNGVDCICYASTVKVGLQNAIDLGDSYESAKQKLDEVSKNPQNYIQELDFDAWGKALEVPAEMQNHEQGMGSQIKVFSVSDLPNTIPTYTGKTHNGKNISIDNKQDLVDRYFSLISKDMELGIDRMFNILGLDKYDKIERNKKLRDLLLAQIDKDESMNPNVKKLLELDEYGNFAIPLNNPIISSLLYKTFFSLSKKLVNKQYMQGGPVVQAAPVLLSSLLHGRDVNGIAFGEDGFNADKGIIYDIAITAPTKEIEMAMLVDEDFLTEHPELANVYEENQYMSVDDAIQTGRLTPSQQEQLKCIAYRIPTEDKYSIFRCRIAQIVPRTQGEMIIMPPEITILSGSDFDIDKMFVELKFDLDVVQKQINNSENISTNIEEVETYEEELYYKQKVQKLRNEIFDLQWFALGLQSSTENHINAGDFSQLKKLAEKVKGKKLNKANIFSMQTQFDLYELNNAGKEFVGIAALNNVSHALSNIANIKFRTLDEGGNILIPNLKINGFELYDSVENGLINADPLKSIFSRKDSFISRTVGMFVGASADNAKEALLGLLNINGVTANVAMSMLRIGVPLDFTVALLTDKEVIDLCKEGKLSTALNQLGSEQYDSIATLNGYNINVKDDLTLVDDNGTEISSSTKLGLLKFFDGLSQAYRSIDSLTSLNSTKNAAGPDIYTTLATKIKVDSLVYQDSSIYFDGDLRSKMFNSLPHLQTTYKIFDSTLAKFVQEVDPLMYDFAFAQQNMLDSGLQKGIISKSYPDKELIKTLYNNYVTYKAYETTFLNNKNDFILNFPEEFNNFAAKIQDNDLVNFLLSKSKDVYEGRLNLVEFENSFTIPDDMKVVLSEAWADLLIDESTRQFGIDLFKYFFNRYGFKTKFANLLSLAPSEIYSYLSEDTSFTNIFNEGITDPTSFITQFCRNNIKLLPTATKDVWEELKSYNYKYITSDFMKSLSNTEIGRLRIFRSSRNDAYIISSKPKAVKGEEVYEVSKLNPLGTKFCMEYYTQVNNEEIENTKSEKISSIYSSAHLANQKLTLSQSDDSVEENDDDVIVLTEDERDSIIDSVNSLKETKTPEEIFDIVSEDYNKEAKKEIKKIIEELC